MRLILFIVLLLLAACDSDDILEREDAEKALYVSYAATDSGSTMNSLMVTDLTSVAEDLKSRIHTYLVKEDTQTLPASVNLAVPELDNFTVPSGMTGSLVSSGNTITAALVLTGYSNSTGTYNGNLNLTGSLDLSEIAKGISFTTLSITVPSLYVTYSSRSFDNCAYANWSISTDNTDSLADYTFDGAFSANSKTYVFQNLTYEAASNKILTIQGVMNFLTDEDIYLVYGNVSIDSSGNWTTGGIILGTSSSSVTVEVDTSVASFEISDENTWDKTGWKSAEDIP